MTPAPAPAPGPPAAAAPFGVLRGPRDVVFGPGQRAGLPALVGRLGRRALVVTDPRLRLDPAGTALVDGLAAAGTAVAVFADAAPELPVEQVSTVAELGRRHRADVVVGLGGGSCLDLAKVAALLLAHGGRPADYYGENRVPGPVVPVVAVPTTAGTGSEVTPVAVLTDPDRTTKVGISSPYLIPAAAVCDPELTLSCPAPVTAAAGADALTHAIESFTAVVRPPDPRLAVDRVFVGKGVLTDGFALPGIRLVAAHLRRACTHPDDLAARAGMALAALAGGFAFGTAGTAAAHALQYPVGALTKTPHGLGVGVLMPYVMAFNAGARTAELAEVAQAMGVPPAGRARAELARAAVRAVADLLASVGIPASLAELGMPAGALGWAADEAMTARRLVENNPRPLDRTAAATLLRAAYDGDWTALLDEALAPATGGHRGGAQ